MTGSRTREVYVDWLVLPALLIILELAFIYEAVSADMAGNQRIFGVSLVS